MHCYSIRNTYVHVPNYTSVAHLYICNLHNISMNLTMRFSVKYELNYVNMSLSQFPLLLSYTPLLRSVSTYVNRELSIN